jgi:hypothetical protein
MPAEYQKFPDERITLITLSGSLSEAVRNPDHDQLDRDLLEIIHETQGRHYFILDVSHLDISFSDLVLAMSHIPQGVQRVGGKNFIDARVTQGMLIDLAVRALSQTQYGGVDARLFASIEEAVSYAREHIRQEIPINH